MLRKLVTRTRCSRFVSLLFVVSLATNVFLFLSSRRTYRVTYAPQSLANLYNEMTPGKNASQNSGQNIPDPKQPFGVLVDQQSKVEIAQFDSNGGSTNCNICPYDPPKLFGPLADMTRDMTPEALIALFPEVKGGRIRPKDCVAREKLAIIIPYRNRYPHLHIFLHNLIPFLTRQQADATIFVIEQAPPETFNRGALLNVGFLEAEKVDSFDCFIFHDVDLIPLDDRHLYRCGDNPKHFAVAINKHNFRMPYKNYFGGIVGVSRRQFLDINGCSNVYFGWGGEDDDMKDRVMNKGYSITRSSVTIARYDMIKHTRDKGNEANPVRKKILASARKRQDIEGLNTIKYSVISVESLPLYIWVNVSLNQSEILQNSPSYILEAMLQAKWKTTVKKSPSRIVSPTSRSSNVTSKFTANNNADVLETEPLKSYPEKNITQSIPKEVILVKLPVNSSLTTD